MTPKQLINLCLYVALTIYIGIGIYGAWLATQSLWPGLHEDGALYSTVIINRSNGFGNAFSVYVTHGHLSQETKYSFYTKFNFHGQLYYPFVSALMPGQDYDSLLRVIHFSNLVAFILSIILFYLLIKRVWCLSRLVSLACGTGLGYAVLGTLQYLQGRPEHGSVIVIVIFGLLRELFFSKQIPTWFSGILIGILAGISPLSGAYYGLLYALSRSVAVKSSKSLISNLLTCSIISIITWSGLTSIVYSESLWSLISNTIMSGENTNEGSFLSLPSFPFFAITPFLNYWFINPFVPFAIFSYVITLGVFILLILRRMFTQPHFLSTMIIFSVALIIFPQFWYVAIFASALNYNVLALFPAMAIWLFENLSFLNRIQAFEMKIKVDHLAEWRSVGLFTSVTFQKLVPVFVVLLFSFPGIGCFRASLMQRSILANGVGYTTAKEAYRKLKAQLANDEAVIITRYSGSQSRSAVVFDGPPWKMITYNYWEESLDKVEAICRSKAKYLIFMQTRDPLPPQIPGFHLIDDAFNRTPVKMFGRLIRATTPGYGYAVYLRSHPE